jgi:divalent metal cation (Fe/Co/Zn/Cd) transporter
MEQSEKIGGYSFGNNVLLAVLKGLFAFLSGSVALFADAIHSLADTISSATVLLGIKISKKKAITFAYGLYKVENLIFIL